MIFINIKDKTHEKKYKNLEWDEKKANEILTRYMIHSSTWDEKNKSFYFLDNGWYITSHNAQKITKRKNHLFCQKYKYKLKKYLLNEFVLEDFTKTIGDCSDGCIEILFTLNKKDS